MSGHDLTAEEWLALPQQERDKFYEAITPIFLALMDAPWQVICDISPAALEEMSRELDQDAAAERIHA